MRTSTRHAIARSPAVQTVCLVILGVSALLILTSTLPLAVGWQPTVVSSGSMEPWLAPGDVVVTSDPAPAELDEGEIVTYPSERAPEGQIIHRLVDRNPDGTWVTRGDANTRADPEAVPPQQISGLAELYVPRVGLPVVWLSTGAFLPFSAWLLVTALAAYGLVLASQARNGELDGDAPDRQEGDRDERRSLDDALSNVPGTWIWSRLSRPPQVTAGARQPQPDAPEGQDADARATPRSRPRQWA